MSVTNPTPGELLDEIVEEATHSGTTSANRLRYLAHFNRAWKWVAAEGVKSFGGSWFFMHASGDFTIPAANTGNPIALNLTSPGPVRKLRALRIGGDNFPLSLVMVDEVEYQNQAWQTGTTGSPSVGYIVKYEPTTNLFYLQIDPLPDSSIVGTMLWDILPVEITDSFLTTDTIRIPSTFREILHWATLERIYRAENRPTKWREAQVEYVRAYEVLQAEHVSILRAPQQMRVGQEDRYRQGLSPTFDPLGMGWL